MSIEGDRQKSGKRNYSRMSCTSIKDVWKDKQETYIIGGWWQEDLGGMS